MQKTIVFLSLFVIALVLGVVIFLIQREHTIIRKSVITGEPTPSSDGNVSIGNGGSSVSEIDVLMFPGKDATQQEKDSHRALIDKVVMKVPYLDLTNCVPTPLVFAHTKGEDLMVKNQDTAKDYVLFWGGNAITLPSGKSITVNAEKIVLGDIGYACYEAGLKNPYIKTI